MGLKDWLAILLIQFTCWSASCQSEPVISESYLNRPLQEVLIELEQEHSILFAYQQEEIKGIFVHAYFDETPIPEAIEKILFNSGMEFMSVGPTDYLIRKNKNQQLSPLLLSGKVVGGNENAPLEWATVYDRKSQQVGYTDDQGNFTLRIVNPASEGELIIEYLGFQQKTIPWRQENNNFFIELERDPVKLATVEVIQRIPTIRQRVKGNGYNKKISLEKIQLGAPGVGDELATLRFLPGVDATQDLSSGLTVRGGDESENLYLLDDIEFWNVGHFFGVFSAFEPKVIDSTRLYLTDFPVEFGGRTSGVVDMKMKYPELGNWKGIVDIHSLYTHFQLNMPLTKKAGLLFNTRFTNRDISDSDIFDVILQNGKVTQEVSNPRDNEFILSIVPRFNFNDNQIKWYWQPSEDTKFSVTLVGGRDDYIAASDVTEQRQGNFQLLTLRHLFDESITWTNGGINLSYDQIVNEHWTSSLHLSGSSQQTKQNLQASLTVERMFRQDTIQINNQNDNEVAGGGIKWSNYIKWGDGHEVIAGFEAENHRSKVRYILGNVDLIRKDTSVNFSVYASHSFKLTSQTKLKYGFRNTYYEPTDQYFFSPRISFINKPLQNWEWGLSVGLYNQFLRTLVYEDALGKMHDIWLLANDSIPVLNSLHLNAHLQYQKEQFLFKMDFFHKRSSNDLRQMWIQRGFNPDTGKPENSNLTIFTGESTSQGVDLFTSWTTKKWSSSVAYTLSWNNIRIDRIDNGEPIPGNNDRRHELNFINEFYAGNWTLGLGAVYGSGLPYTSAVVVDGSDRRNLTIDESVRRLKDYFRVDLSAAYDFKLWNDQWSAGISIFNLFDRANTDQIQYLYNLSFLNSSSGDDSNIFGSEIQLLPRTVDIHLTWRFD